MGQFLIQRLSADLAELFGLAPLSAGRRRRSPRKSSTGQSGALRPSNIDLFAAQVAAMDLVITIDNSTAHQAGALGVPVWVQLPFAPDWSWLERRSDSPWYPSTRLFRQSKPGDWQGVVEAVQAALSEDGLGDRLLETRSQLGR